MGNVPIQTINSLININTPPGEGVEDSQITGKVPDWLRDPPLPEKEQDGGEDTVEKSPLYNETPAKESIDTLGDPKIKQKIAIENEDIAENQSEPEAPVGDGKEEIDTLITEDKNTKFGDMEENNLLSEIKEKNKPAHGRRIV